MKNLLGTIALGLAAMAAMPSAAATRVVDFEDYSVGDAFTVFKINDFENTGVLFGDGVIAHDPQAGIGNYFNPNESHGFGYSQIRFYAPRLSEFVRYTPTLESFDIYAEATAYIAQPHLGITHVLAPGAWQTIDLSYLITGGSTFKFFGGPVRLDNFVFEDGETYLPEPQTWALIILGFGLAGVGLRRRAAEARGLAVRL